MCGECGRVSSRYAAAYSVAGIGLMLVGFGFILAGITSLFSSGGAGLLGLVLAVVGLVLFFMEWSRYGAEERRLSVYAVILYIVGEVIVVLAGAAVYALDVTSRSLFHVSSPLSGAVQALGGAFGGIMIYLAFLLFPYGFAGRDEKTILLVGLIGGLIVSVVLNPLSIGGSLYAISGANIAGLAGLVSAVVSLIFGVAYLVIGNNVRVRH